MKPKIGLVTLWEKNYGSSLQCYAMKEEIKKRGYDCELIAETFYGLGKYKHYIKELVSLMCISVHHLTYFKDYLNSRKAVRFSANSLSKESDFQLNLFCESVLQPRKYSYEHLTALAKEDKYKFFIAGSDQIWPGQKKMDDVKFLRFASGEKRIAYAPSFGTDNVADFNRSSFKKEISKFSRLSAREARGCEIIKELTGIEVPKIADPTFLRTRDEWSDFAKASQIYEQYKSKKYILFHFLDKPNEVVIQCLEYFLKETNYEIVGFAYPHEELDTVLRYRNIDGSPVDYVALIEHAEYVLTDSFHTTVFSLFFSRKFFTFKRQYRHKFSQHSRITTLLNSFGYEERLILNVEEFIKALSTELHSCCEIFKEERMNANKYLDEAIGTFSGKVDENLEADINKGKMTLAEEQECVGCMACFAVCVKDAISIVVTQDGYEVPKINSEKCIQCGKCQAVCVAKKRNNVTCKEKEAYVAYCTDSKLREKAASGGIFGAIATSFLRNSGVVFGARLRFDSGIPVIKHVQVDSENELPTIMGSKYVQSDISESYEHIRKLLNEGNKVLFCGTSCQVDAVYNYLKLNKCSNMDNFFTIDLICHGVPGRKFFQDYIQMLEKKNNSVLSDFTFRLKDNLHKQIIYQETLIMSPDRGEKKSRVSVNKSPYYRMFLCEESYRDACYECKYASINKPADITLGDYFELADDYPELYKALLRKSAWDINSMIIHTSKGRELLKLAENLIEVYNVDIKRVQASHKQLCKPSLYTPERQKILHRYRENGFREIDTYYKKKDILMYFPVKLKRLFFG